MLGIGIRPAGPGGVRPPNARTRIGDNIEAEMDDLMNGDAYRSSAGFGDARDRMRQEMTESLGEQERNPELAGEIIDTMDGDAVLLNQILADRRGLRGLWNRFKNNNITRVAMTTLKWGVAGAGLIATSAALASGAAAAVPIGVMAAGAAEGALTGGILGAVRGRMRGKNIQESAGTWMGELGILKCNRSQLEQMNPGELVLALGVMRNAIMERKVRGNDTTRLEMVLKYRHIKTILARSRQELVDEGEELNPALAAVDEALLDSRDELSLISKAAGEKYQGVYDTIIENKGDIVKMHQLKGATRGAALGAIFGWLSPIVKAYLLNDGTPFASQATNTATNTSTSGVNSVPNTALDAKMAELRMDPDIISQTQQNAANLDIYNDYIDNGFPPPAGTSTEMINHLTKLDQIVVSGQHASLSGFSHSADFSDFGSILQSGAANIKEIGSFLGSHNIDPTFSVANQPFSEFLAANQSIFLSLPQGVQGFVLSHPSVAPEIFAVASNASELAISTLMTKLTSALALAEAAAPALAGGALAGSLVSSGRVERTEAHRAKNTAISEAKTQARKEVKDVEDQRQERRRTELVVRLTGARISLDPAFILSQIPLVAPVGPRPTNSFDIESIDEDGNIVFANENSDWDNSMRSAGVNPYPPMNIRQITNDTRTELNPAIATLVLTPADVEAQRGRDEEDSTETQSQEAERNASLERIRSSLLNQDIILMPALINTIPGTRPQRARWIANPRFRVLNINPGIDGQIGFQANPAVPLPPLRMSDIVELSGNQYIPRLDRVILTNLVTPSAPGAPGAPGAPAAPTAPAIDLEPIRTALVGTEHTGRLINTPQGVALETGGTIRELGSANIILKGDGVPKLGRMVSIPGIVVRLNEVKLENNRPVFDADVALRFGGNDYVFKQSLAVGRNAGKTTFLNSLQTGLQNDRQMLYTAGRFLRFDNYTAPTGGGAGGGTYNFTELDMALASIGPQALTVANLEALELTQFEQV